MKIFHSKLFAFIIGLLFWGEGILIFSLTLTVGGEGGVVESLNQGILKGEVSLYC
jgi:hypothetical protein